jgi:predicted transcriptional regulator
MNRSRFQFKRSSTPDKPVAPELGPLERDVMKFVWNRFELGSEASVRDVYLAFNERLAYTTLMTTLDRLYKKGLLERRKDGRAFYYSPRQTSQEFSRNTTRRVIDKLIGSNEHGVEPVLACIVDAVSDRDRELLDELDRLIDEKRRTLPAKE